MKKQDAPTISKEDAEEWTQSLGQIASGAYRQIALADKLGVPEALGYPSLRDWVTERMGGYIRYSVEERRKIVEELNANGESLPKIAQILGVDASTLYKDPGLENSIPKRTKKSKSVENSTSEELPHRKKSAAEVEVELHRAADQGVETLVWNKVKDRFLPFWENLLNSLEEDERPFLIWAVHSFADQYEEKRANQ
jgi:transposase-like protein